MMISSERRHRELVPEWAPASAMGILAAGAVGLLVWKTISPDPRFVLGLSLDRIAGLLTLLVGGIGVVVCRYTLRLLDGNPGRGRFIAWLCITICCADLIMLADNLFLLFFAWFATSIGLHQLLTFCADRPQALPPARKKFLISRLGDLGLISAIALIGWHWHTFQIHLFLSHLAAGDTGPACAVGSLIALAGLTKSAQFPFHSWLPETMESPTPVSALMHAGIINAGGALMLRFAPLIGCCPLASTLLVMFGSVTILLAMPAMWAQVKVKRTLAWSTVAQMGFMMIECGLGAFPAAMLHILGHGCYKAHSFLRCGELPQTSAKTQPGSLVSRLGWFAAGTLFGVAWIGCWARLFDVHLRQHPGEWAISILLALAIGQVWVHLLADRSTLARGALEKWCWALGCTALGSGLSVGIYRAMSVYLGNAILVPTDPIGGRNWGVAMAVVAIFIALALLGLSLPALVRRAGGRALFTHALQGFYFGAIADRMVAGIWPRSWQKEWAHV